MKQITRDLYTSGRVWLSLSHSFSQNSGDSSEIELVKVTKDFVTLNAGALFILSLWSTGSKQPEKFYIPEYKIEELRLILSSLRDLKSDERYVRDGELTDKGKPSSLYYRLVLNNKRFFDVYFVENEFNGEKSINIAIELESKNVYSLYDSNVVDLIEVIPTMADIARYKQSAAELYYIKTYLIGGSDASVSENKPTSAGYKKSSPRTVTKVDRTNINKKVEETKSTQEETKPEETSKTTDGLIENIVEKNEKEVTKSGFNYNDLLEDE